MVTTSQPSDDQGFDPTQGRSFGETADEYERLRFRPPPEALRWLLTGDERRVLDLAAGTGQVAGDLSALGVEVIAVEPDDRMLAELRRRHPGVEAFTGRAESIPIGAASVDAVVVSGAWHWFDEPAAAAEVGRVLRGGGRLGVVATTVDVDVPWVQRLYHPDALSYRRNAFRRHSGIALPAEMFAPVEATRFGVSRTMSPGDILAWFRTYSVYRTADAAIRARWETQIAEVLDELYPGAEAIEMPAVCRCWRAGRRGSPAR